jgi:hypothetical protein
MPRIAICSLTIPEEDVAAFENVLCRAEGGFQTLPIHKYVSNRHKTEHLVPLTRSYTVSVMRLWASTSPQLGYVSAELTGSVSSLSRNRLTLQNCERLRLNSP